MLGVLCMWGDMSEATSEHINYDGMIVKKMVRGQLAELHEWSRECPTCQGAAFAIVHSLKMPKAKKNIITCHSGLLLSCHSGLLLPVKHDAFRACFLAFCWHGSLIFK